MTVEGQWYTRDQIWGFFQQRRTQMRERNLSFPQPALQRTSPLPQIAGRPGRCAEAIPADIAKAKPEHLYRAVIHCDRGDSGKCHGLMEYSSPDRIDAGPGVRPRLPGQGVAAGLPGQRDLRRVPGCQTSEERAMIRSEPQGGRSNA